MDKVRCINNDNLNQLQAEDVRLISEVKVKVERLILTGSDVIMVKIPVIDASQRMIEAVTKQIREWLDGLGYPSVQVLFVCEGIDISALSESDMLRYGWKRISNP